MIRPITAEDLPRCLHVIRASFATVAEEFGLTEENAPTNGAFMKLDRLQRYFDRGDPMFGAFADGEIIGFIQLVPKGGGVIELEKLAVLPEKRHAGYGKRLLHFAADTARALGGKKLTLGMIEENTRLKNWYIENGFTHTGTKKFDHLPFTTGFLEIPVGTTDGT